jgi:hypothetical protein
MADEDKTQASDVSAAKIIKKALLPKSKTKGRNAKQLTKAPTQWTFPKNTLEESIKIPQIIEEKYAGKPTETADIVKLVGFKRTDDWRFLDLLRSANLYTIVEGSGARATVELTGLGSDIVAPDSPQKRQSALLKAFEAVELFKKVHDYYKGKRIPEEEFFGNTLVRTFDVPKDRVPTFINVFTKNLQYLKQFNPSAEDINCRCSLMKSLLHRRSPM